MVEGVCKVRTWWERLDRRILSNNSSTGGGKIKKSRDLLESELFSFLVGAGNDGATAGTSVNAQSLRWDEVPDLRWLL